MTVSEQTSQAEAPGSASGSPARAGQIAQVLGALGTAAQARFAERVADLGIGVQHTLVLRAVGLGPGRSQNEIASATGLSPSRLVTLIDELEALDAVRRHRASGDRRRHSVQLTDAGRELIRQVARAAADHGTAMLAGLSAAEREQLHDLLARVRVEAAAHRQS
ncbi:MAG: MarR family winged helix-turn-helix transcriptional regulator [Kineosporiaceae bacterium]